MQVLRGAGAGGDRVWDALSARMGFKGVPRLALALTAALVCAQAALAGPSPTSKQVDPRRYAGRWYEVARMPNKTQSNCEAATSDWTRESDGSFAVVQTCHMGAVNGSTKTWRGSGHIVDDVTNARFRIGFFGGLIQMDYWVLDLSDDYSWCMLSTPNPKFLWIMSRRPNLTADQKAALVARARAMGFDTSKLIFDNQPSA